VSEVLEYARGWDDSSINAAIQRLLELASKDYYSVIENFAWYLFSEL
jgi:hypothetical protein